MSDESMLEPLRPSVFYAESIVHCTLQSAWRMMQDYKAWNPEFVCAETALVRGEPRTEGELTLITPLGENRIPLSQFYAETVKVVAPHHMVWHVFPKDGDSFRNFVDFGVEEAPSGVKFRIYYYAQNRVTLEALAQFRAELETGLCNLTMAFKRYCEAQSSPME